MGIAELIYRKRSGLWSQKMKSHERMTGNNVLAIHVPHKHQRLFNTKVSLTKEKAYTSHIRGSTLIR
jgi:hypothetical protein